MFLALQGLLQVSLRWRTTLLFQKKWKKKIKKTKTNSTGRRKVLKTEAKVELKTYNDGWVNNESKDFLRHRNRIFKHSGASKGCLSSHKLKVQIQLQDLTIYLNGGEISISLAPLKEQPVLVFSNVNKITICWHTRVKNLLLPVISFRSTGCWSHPTMVIWVT